MDKFPVLHPLQQYFSHIRWTELFMYFCIMKYIGTKGDKNIFNLPVVYAIDHSKAMVPVLFLILCSFVVYTTGRLMF